MKVGSKRRRTKNEIEDQKQEEVLKQQKLEADMQELANLRQRVQAAEDRALNNEGAAQLMHHMRDAGLVEPAGDNQINVNAPGGVRRFDVEAGLQDIVVDFQDDGNQIQQEPVQQV